MLPTFERKGIQEANKWLNASHMHAFTIISKRLHLEVQRNAFAPKQLYNNCNDNIRRELTPTTGNKHTDALKATFEFHENN